MIDVLYAIGYTLLGAIVGFFVLSHPLFLPFIRAVNNSAYWFLVRPIINFVAFVQQYCGPLPQNWKTPPDDRAQKIVKGANPFAEEREVFPDDMRYLILDDGYKIDIVALIKGIPLGLTHHLHDRLHVDLMRDPERRPEKMIDVGGKIRDLDIIVDRMSEDQKFRAHSFLHLWTRESQVWLKEP